MGAIPYNRRNVGQLRTTATYGVDWCSGDGPKPLAGLHQELAENAGPNSHALSGGSRVKGRSNVDPTHRGRAAHEYMPLPGRRRFKSCPSLYRKYERAEVPLKRSAACGPHALKVSCWVQLPPRLPKPSLPQPTRPDQPDQPAHSTSAPTFPTTPPKPARPNPTRLPPPPPHPPTPIIPTSLVKTPQANNARSCRHAIPRSPGPAHTNPARRAVPFRHPSQSGPSSPSLSFPTSQSLPSHP